MMHGTTDIKKLFLSGIKPMPSSPRENKHKKRSTQESCKIQLKKRNLPTQISSRLLNPFLQTMF
jgi:hypothetical protein